jgi:hypothetical protein
MSVRRDPRVRPGRKVFKASQVLRVSAESVDCAESAESAGREEKRARMASVGREVS